MLDLAPESPPTFCWLIAHLIDCCSFLQSCASRSRACCALASGQVDEVDPAHFLHHFASRRIRLGLGHNDLENGVRSRAGGVHVRRCSSPRENPRVHQLTEMIRSNQTPDVEMRLWKRTLQISLYEETALRVRPSA